MRQALVPSQTALVLGGGGAKGAYEVGAIRALEELGIRAGSVYGTSVGALNAALYAQGDFGRLEALWEDLTLGDVVSEDFLALADDAEAVFDHPEKLLEFLSRTAQKKGLDIAPLVSMLRGAIDEAAIRRSGVTLGLVTTKFPTLSAVEKRLADMEDGSLCDWLLASASCFPIFPMKQIGDERYIDGGFCDNTPVSMAVRGGAKHIIALDIGRHRSHAQYALRPNVTYIRASHPLGGLLTFDPALTRRNRILGYNDAMRAFGRLRGVRYAFDPIDAQAHFSRARDFVVRLTQFEAALPFQNALAKGDGAPLFSLLEEELPQRPDALDYFLRAFELLADVAGADPAQVFTIETLRGEIAARLPLEKAEAMLDSLLGGRIGVLFSSPQMDRRLVVSCLYRLLQRENAFSALALHTLAAFPRELLCALALRELL